MWRRSDLQSVSIFRFRAHMLLHLLDSTLTVHLSFLPTKFLRLQYWRRYLHKNYKIIGDTLFISSETSNLINFPFIYT